MINLLTLILLLSLNSCIGMETNKVTRADLLSVHLCDKQGLSSVEIKRITIPKKGKADYHLHPCPVVGHVVSGTLLFQIEGESPQLLNAGDAFYEPKNQPVLHFDNASDSEPLIFIAYYLLEGDEDLITLLPHEND